MGYSPWGHKRVRYILAAPAAAKSPQSCLTLCGPRDSSPPATPVPGTLQARTLEWVAISFSIGRNDAKAETPVLWPPHAKS